jgi:hypothetical protein
MLAEAVPPVPPSIEVIAPVVLFFTPPLVAVTFTVMVQEAPAARVPAASVICPDPATAVVAPEQVPVKPLGVATTRPAGSASLNAIPVSPAVPFGLVMVKVSEVEPLSGMVGAPKALAIVGGAITVIDALEVFPEPASVEVFVTLLFFTPAVVPVTLNETTQEALGASVAPPSDAEAAPGTAVAVPEHVLARLEGVAMTNPAGKLSVKARPVSGIVFEDGFAIVNERLVDPLTGIVAAPNALAIVGGAATVRFALAVLPVPPLVEVTAPVVLV